VTAGARAVLVTAAAGVMLVPLATAHTLAPLLLGHPLAHWISAPTAHPAIGLVFLLTLLSALPASAAAHLILRQGRLHRRVAQVATLGRVREHEGIEYTVIPGTAVAFFTAGLRRPTIFVTEGAEQSLPPPAFHAALLHEQAHARRNDTAWLALVALLDAAFGRLPWVRAACRTFRLCAERSADECALLDGASREGLFDAIVSAAAAGSPGAALSEAGVTERLQWLSEPDTARPPGLTYPSTILLGSILVLPTSTHLMVWVGLVCVVCLSHTG
jgi:Zn-dependent protease with chaperone function